MSNQLKEQKESIDQKVAKILEDLTTEDTIKTIRNWLNSDKVRIGNLVTNLNDVIAGDFQYKEDYQKIDGKQFYELIESYRYTISLMEQAIIEA